MLFLLFLYLLCVATVLGDSSQRGIAFDLERATLERFTSHAHLNISWNELRQDVLDLDGPHNVMFVHATIGVFKKKRGKAGTWGHGREILEEMLETVEKSNLLHFFRRVYIGTVGNKDDVGTAVESVSSRFHSSDWRKRLRFIVSGENIEHNEFPTLSILQLYANLVPEADAASSHILWTHTKGVRQNGAHASDWRRYMLHMVLQHYLDICKPAMREKGYKTCGVLKTPTSKGPIYAGNFWWSTAAFLQSHGDRIREMAWSNVNRYAAENFLLHGVNASVSKTQHMCFHHTHHDMQNCRTPPSLYNTELSLALRAHGDCFSANLRPKNQTKLDPSTWCHHSSLPILI